MKVPERFSTFWRPLRVNHFFKPIRVTWRISLRVITKVQTAARCVFWLPGSVAHFPYMVHSINYNAFLSYDLWSADFSSTKIHSSVFFRIYTQRPGWLQPNCPFPCLLSLLILLFHAYGKKAVLLKKVLRRRCALGWALIVHLNLAKFCKLLHAPQAAFKGVHQPLSLRLKNGKKHFSKLFLYGVILKIYWLKCWNFRLKVLQRRCYQILL